MSDRPDGVAWAPPVRAVYDAVALRGVPRPYDTVHWRATYPAAAPDPERDPTQGLVAPAAGGEPLPVVVLFPNFNCGPELYAWLARRLALAGTVCVTFSWVGPLFGGRPGLATGVDLDAIAPGVLGRRRTNRVLEPLLASVAANSELRGAVDVTRVVVGGHSAGGTLALLTAGARWYPMVRGAFSYGGHTRAQVAQGFGEHAYLPIPGRVPLLLLGGTADGVVTAVARAQTGTAGDDHPMRLTFERSVPAGTPAWLLLVEGANHYLVAEGYDGTTGRGYLEPPGTVDPAAARDLVGSLVVDLAQWCLQGDTAARDRLDRAVTEPMSLVAVADRRT